VGRRQPLCAAGPAARSGKGGHPAISDLSGSIGIDSKELLTKELMRVEGERSRLLKAQRKTILAGCAERLNQAGHPAVRRLQMHGALDKSWPGLTMSG
jgi:hypothetical protein